MQSALVVECCYANFTCQSEAGTRVCLFHSSASAAEAEYCNYEPKKAQQHLFLKILLTKICTNVTTDSSGVLCSVILESNLFCKSFSILIYFLLIIFLHGSSLFIACLVFIVLQLKRCYMMNK